MWSISATELWKGVSYGSLSSNNFQDNNIEICFINS